MYIPLGEREEAKKIKQSGIAEGMAQGIAKGKEEMARDMARKLLAKGISLDIIAQSAELPVEQIRSMVN